MYSTAVHALGLKPEEVAMVAAHEWDLEAARETYAYCQTTQDFELTVAIQGNAHDLCGKMDGG